MIELQGIGMALGWVLFQHRTDILLRDDLELLIRIVVQEELTRTCRDVNTKQPWLFLHSVLLKEVKRERGRTPALLTLLTGR